MASGEGPIELKELMAPDIGGSEKALAALGRLFNEIDPSLPENTRKLDYEYGESDGYVRYYIIRAIQQPNDSRETLAFALVIQGVHNFDLHLLDAPELYFGVSTENYEQPEDLHWFVSGDNMQLQYDRKGNFQERITTDGSGRRKETDFDTEKAVSFFMNATPEQKLRFMVKDAYLRLEATDPDKRTEVFLDMLLQCAKAATN